MEDDLETLSNYFCECVFAPMCPGIDWRPAQGARRKLLWSKDSPKYAPVSCNAIEKENA